MKNKIKVSGGNYIVPVMCTVILCIIKFTVFELPWGIVLLPIFLYLGFFCIVILQLVLSIFIIYLYNSIYGHNNN